MAKKKAKKPAKKPRKKKNPIRMPDENEIAYGLVKRITRD
jgi:hypothetical protein